MRVLSIGTDRHIFEEGSAVRRRQIQYAEHFDALDIIVPTVGEAYTQTVFENVSVFPTRSWSKLLSLFGIVRLALSLKKPDVITAQDPFEIGLIGIFLSWKLGVPLHVQVHTDFLSSGFVRHSALNRLRRRIALFVLRRATRVRVVLASLKERLEDRGISSPVTVLPIYVDVQKLSHIVRVRNSRFAFSALCIGRLTSEKNFTLAIDAVKKAREEEYDIGLTILGDGPLKSVLQEKVQNLGLIGRVELVGEKEIASYLATADIVLVPSVFEGYGLVIVEALAAGIPVLAMDVGVAHEAGALLSTPKQFAKDLMKWMRGGPRNAQLNAQLYANEEEYIARYTADIAACLE